MNIISKDINKAVKLLTENKLVAIPTETVYGLAGNIFSEEAIQNIFKTKQRPLFNPLIVHIPNAEYLKTIVKNVPEKAKLLAKNFWPGSMTLVLQKKEIIPSLITAGKDTVAVRIPNHPVTLELLSKLNFPLAAPSANPFNRISPTKPEHVANYFNKNLEMVLDGGVCKSGIESTIIGFENNEPIIYRLGALSVEEIEKVVGKVAIKNKKEKSPDAPGMLAKHYAPRTKTILTDKVLEELKYHKGKKVGVISFVDVFTNDAIKANIILSKERSLAKAASKLYNAMHELDEKKLDVILIEKLPNEGLGRSMNDRLERASS